MREAVVTFGDAAFASLGIDELVSLCRSAGLRTLEELACHGTGAVVEVEVESRLDEDRLRTLECVDRWTRVDTSDGTELYVIAFTAPELPEDVADHADDLVGDCDPDVGERGATVSLVGPQRAIRDVIGDYETVGASPELRRLGGYEGSDRPLAELTDRQREVVRTAYDMGYYEVPREASTADVAAELDVDPSTAAEHLQRAERNLLAPQLSSRR